MSHQANCPSCGAPLTFRPGTMVAVCAHCTSLSARTDRDPLLIGKVAALVDSDSPLQMGMGGQFAGRKFKVMGRTQLKHPLGGFWNEWYLAFDDDRWGWLAEAQGRSYLTFRQELNQPIPPLEALSAGAELDFGSRGRWVVNELSEGIFQSAEGEIPWAVELEGRYRFADLSGANGAFATLDFSEEPPLFFVGRQLDLDELKLTGGVPRKKERLKALSLPCPHCASPLTLRAPDETQRVGCPSCGSLLDASAGKLIYLRSVKQPDARMWIPLGTEGHLRGVPLVCVGFLRRACIIEGVTYDWGEYLMMDPKHGFRWLVESDGHWNLAENVPPSEISRTGANAKALSYQGETYKRFQDVEAHVQGVYGECYWKVEINERAQVAEFVRAPISLAEERQQHPGGGEEINWSRSTYLEGAEVWKAFNLKGSAPAPQNIASNQPNPLWSRARQMGLWMLVSLVLLFILLVWNGATHREKLIHRGSYNLAERLPKIQAVTPPAEAAQEPIFFSQPFRVEDGHKNIEVKLNAPVMNSWIGVEGSIVNQDTGVAELFETSSSYYFGSDSDGAWKEGAQTGTVYLSALPAGNYLMAISPQWDGPTPPVKAFTVEVRSGVMRWSYYLIALLAILIVPALAALRALSFESRRWQESMYSASNSS
ncbi:MAG: DUF4178 domain-containing protein [Holophaga sp.]|nr:DUF4178 domain-containing protein [Holophaga sp.]